MHFAMFSSCRSTRPQLQGPTHAPMLIARPPDRGDRLEEASHRAVTTLPPVAGNRRPGLQVSAELRECPLLHHIEARCGQLLEWEIDAGISAVHEGAFRRPVRSHFVVVEVIQW